MQLSAKRVDSSCFNYYATIGVKMSAVLSTRLKSSPNRSESSSEARELNEFFTRASCRNSEKFFSGNFP